MATKSWKNWWNWAAVVGTVLGAGCSDAKLGDACTADEDCPSGIGCYLPADSSAGVCTVSCESGPCSTGTCTSSVDGKACTRTCTMIEDCNSDAPCQTDSDGQMVCWVPDTTMTIVPDGLVVSSVELQDPSNSPIEGLVRGRQASVSVFVRYSGKSYKSGWGEVAALGTGIEIIQCYKCSDQSYSDFYIESAFVSLEIAVASNASPGMHSFRVTIHYNTGETSTDEFLVEVLP